MTTSGKWRLVSCFAIAVFLGIVVAASLNQGAFTSPTITGAVIYALTAGSIYAIAASGLVVTYTTSGVFNFAQGAMGMILAFLYWEVRINHGWPAWVALVFVVLIVAPLFGAVIERVLMRRLVQAPLVVQLVVTIGLMFFLMGLASTIWDENAISPLPEFFADKHGIDIGDVVLTWHRFITIAVAVLIAGFLRILLYRSRTGVAMRAVVDDRGLAGLQGIRPGRVSALAWALGTMMAAVAGILLAPNVGLRVDALTLFIVDAFAAAIIGRLRSLPWTFAGGLVIGVAQSFALNFLQWGGRWSTAAIAIPAVILFLALLALPEARIEAGRSIPEHRVARVPDLRRSLGGMAALVTVVVLVAEFGGLDTTNLRRLTLAFITAVIMLSLVPLTGWAGQISLAQITFVGVGAFTMAEVAGDAQSWLGAGNPLGLLVSAAVAVPFGVLMALPALRLQGLYLALASMAFAVMAIPLFFAQPEILGSSGRRLATPRFLGIDFDDAHNFLVLAAVVFAVLGLFVVWLRRGRFGRRLLAFARQPRGQRDRRREPRAHEAARVRAGRGRGRPRRRLARDVPRHRGLDGLRDAGGHPDPVAAGGRWRGHGQRRAHRRGEHRRTLDRAGRGDLRRVRGVGAGGVDPHRSRARGVGRQPQPRGPLDAVPGALAVAVEATGRPGADPQACARRRKRHRSDA